MGLGQCAGRSGWGPEFHPGREARERWRACRRRHIITVIANACAAASAKPAPTRCWTTSCWSCCCFARCGAGITELKVVQAAASRLLRGAIKKRPVLSSWSSVLDYCRTAQGFSDREQFRVLFLDKRNALIADEVQQTGTVDHTPVYPREVVKRALELSATAIILVHNHPSGDPTPSHADIQMTKAIVAVAGPLGISVHDHLIVGRDGHVSMKGLKLI